MEYQKRSASIKTLGFILKRFLPFKGKFSLFTLSSGKLDFIAQSPLDVQKLWPGMLIAANLKSSHSKIYFGSNIEIIQAPLEGARHNIAWLHHILELSYYFLSLEDPAQKVFFFLETLLSFFSEEDSFLLTHEPFKKMSIAYFFFLCGFYPTNPELIGVLGLLEEKLFLSVDFNKKGAVQSFEKIMPHFTHALGIEIDRWILECMNEHPARAAFKTLAHKNIVEQ